jgi:hypothetical protein
MPNYDAGHYFLTVLAPVKAESILVGDQSHSHKHLIKDALALLPNSELTSAALKIKPAGSPFARTTRTHFARFAVLDDVVFNGRVSGDSLVDQIRDINPLTPRSVDTLTTPFLIFCADFDADSGGDSVLRDYTGLLWDSMSTELTKVFRHCVGFDAVTTAEGFHGYIKRCQIETSLPFNDYWYPVPALSNFNITPYKIPAIIAGIAFLLGLLGVIVGVIGTTLFGVWSSLIGYSGWLALLGLLAIALLAAVGFFALLAKARQPFPKSPPPGPGSDLPTVLKALSMQRAFTAFAIANQGKDEPALHAAFGEFLARQQPNNTSEATQPPGVIGI